MGGVKFGFRAMNAYLGEAKSKGEALPATPHGMSEEELFFVAYGQTWCTKSSHDGVLAQIQTDEHAPARERVNGPLSNNDDFHKTFQCPAGSPMNPTVQCRMW